MITVIKTARVAELAFPLHGQKRYARPLPAAQAGAGSNGDAARAAQHVADAELRQQSSDAAASMPGAGAHPGQEMAGTQAADERDIDASATAISATYAEGYEDGQAEGLREGHRRGREEGLAEGLEQGRRDANESTEAHERRFRALADAIGAASAKWEAELEAGAIEIAHAALLRILGEAAGSRDAVVAMVRKVMEQLPERRALSIHLSPSDHALLEADSADLPLGGATLVADERVELGGCIVDTDAGSLDGRLEIQLAGLRDLLLALHRSGGAPQ